MTQFDAISDGEIARPAARIRLEELVMLDIVFIGITLVFFAACLGYTLACERL